MNGEDSVSAERVSPKGRVRVRREDMVKVQGVVDRTPRRLEVFDP